MLNVYRIVFEDGLVEIISEISAYEARRTATWCGTRTAHGVIVKFVQIGRVEDMEQEIVVGQEVVWGPADYPRAGIVRTISASGKYAFIQDARNIYTQVAVTELRVAVKVDSPQG